MGDLNVNFLTMNLHSLCIISLKPSLFGHTLLKLKSFFFWFVNGVRIFHNEKFPLYLTQKIVALLHLLPFVFSSSCNLTNLCQINASAKEKVLWTFVTC